MENWYIAKLVCQIVCGDGRHRPQFEEQWRLIQASDSKVAATKAEAMIQSETLSTIAAMLPVQWRFISLAELIPLQEMSDGQELISITREPYDQQSYLDHLQGRRHTLQPPFDLIKT